MLRVFLCITLFILADHANANDVEISITQGTLTGKYEKTWKGRTFSAFTGIPYAKPPVGDLRFKARILLFKISNIFLAKERSSTYFYLCYTG